MDKLLFFHLVCAIMFGVYDKKSANEFIVVETTSFQFWCRKSIILTFYVEFTVGLYTVTLGHLETLEENISFMLQTSNFNFTITLDYKPDLFYKLGFLVHDATILPYLPILPS